MQFIQQNFSEIVVFLCVVTFIAGGGILGMFSNEVTN